MTKQDLLKYAGKKTFGKNSSLLTNGVIVAFDANDDNECLVARFENGDVSGEGWSRSAGEITFFTEKEEEIYKSGKGCYLFAKIDNVIMDEQKELDLTKILRGCEGVELWSDIFGKCKLSRIDLELTYQIKVETFKSNGKVCEQCFTSDGKLYAGYPNGKCMLWPSETNRDWSTFKKPVKVLDDDFVACTGGNGVYTVIKYGNISENWEYIIPYDKFRPDLTEEDLKKLNIV